MCGTSVMTFLLIFPGRVCRRFDDAVMNAMIVDHIMSHWRFDDSL